VGHRNPDRVPLMARRARCETIGQMLREGWEVEAWCVACRLKLRVDLRTIAIVRGPTFSLWNRASRCRRVGCRGRVEFHARAPGMTGVERLAVPNAPQVDDVTPGWLRHLPKV
jgi:hypothetical protein